MPTAGAKTHEARLARSCRGQVFAVHEHDINLRSVTEPGEALLHKVGVQNAAIGEEDPLEKSAADALNDRAR